jgi:hypothetical protein
VDQVVNKLPACCGNRRFVAVVAIAPPVTGPFPEPAESSQLAQVFYVQISIFQFVLEAISFKNSGTSCGQVFFWHLYTKSFFDHLNFENEGSPSFPIVGKH